MKIDRLRRIFKMIQLLYTGGARNAVELASRLNVSDRTLFRDFNALKDAGIEYVFDRDTNRYVLSKGGLLPPVHLTPPEALALLLLVRKFLDSRVLPDIEPAASAGLKIESLLPLALQDYCGPLLEQVEIRPAPGSDAEPIAKSMLQLQKAVADGQKVQVVYESYAPRETLETVLCVYRIAHIHRGWYVIAHSKAHRDVRTFKIERFTSIKVLDERYRIDRNFSLDSYFGNAWSMIRDPERHHVRVEFSPLVAGNIQEIIWHRSQRITRRVDGSILFEADVDGLQEIAWWVLGYGDQARVLDPPKLRQDIARRAAAMHKMYAATNGHGPGRPGGRRGRATRATPGGEAGAAAAGWNTEG